MKNSYKWIYPQNNISEDLFSRIKEVAGSDIITKLLINRGIESPEDARYFIDLDNTEISSPYVFPDMGKSVQRINKAIQNKEHIVVYGDFDADGVTSTALLYKTIKLLGADASFYLPDRQEEGHGLNRASVCKLISSRKAKLIITVDCGVSNVSEVKLAESLGANVIITDHHESQKEIPPAFAIINPKMLEDNKLNRNLKYLAGVGVAYKLACALLESNNKEYLHDEIFYFVALGTVGDVVPLLGENRAFVYRGMNLISQKRPSSIGKILEIGGYKSKQKISTSVIAFGIVPKINAVGRLMDASPIIDFLLSEDEEELNIFADKLNKNNKKRQEMCEETFIEAEALLQESEDLENNKAIILAKENWHPGIIGIVASKFVEKYYRPVFLVSLDKEKQQARGSARSIDNLNLFDTLSEFADLFIQFGGHALAAGFSFDLNKVSFQSFKEKLNNSVNNNLSTETLDPELKIDVEIQPEDLTESFIKEVGTLEPFGEANPTPVFSMSNLTLIEIKKMGAKKNHLKLFLEDENGLTFEAVWWNKEHLHVEEHEKLNIAFTPSINNYMDKSTIQLIIKDVKLSSDKTPEFEEPQTVEELFESEFEEIVEIIEEIEEENNIVDSKITEKESAAKEIKWFDKRNSTGFKKDFTDKMKSLKENIAVFAETVRAVNIFEKDDVLKTLPKNRTELKKADYLVIMDLPPDKNTFLNILNKTEAKEIHLVGLKPEIDPVETVKKFSGMLKYAHKNKNGIVNFEQMGSLLSLSSDSILACVELLDSAGIIEVQELFEDSVKFNYFEGAGLNELVEKEEYQAYINSLEKSEEFRQKMSVLEINQIQTSLNQVFIETV